MMKTGGSEVHAIRMLELASEPSFLESSMIEVVVRNRPVGSGAVFYHEPSIVRYVGELMDNPRHVAADCITISGDGFIPYRVISKRDIVRMGGRTVEFKPALETSQTWRVLNSKGDAYTVTRNRSLWSCTCVGFGFRRDCKHVREKKNELQQAS